MQQINETNCFEENPLSSFFIKAPLWIHYRWCVEIVFCSFARDKSYKNFLAGSPPILLKWDGTE